jgi:glycosyltransferase involved in cell wall biosynthesis
MKPVVLGGIAARVAGVRGVVTAIPGLGYAFTSTGVWAAMRKSLLTFGLRVALRHPNSVVIFQNPDDMAQLLQAHVVDREKCALIRGAGVDTDEFARSLEPTTRPRVLFASRMLREKGVEIFVQAAGILRARGLEADFMLAGQPDPANPGSISERELKQWHDSGVIRWLGHCDDMPSLLRSVHIVCLPSFYGEGVPKVLIEAAAIGRAIVATDMPGCREIVQHRCTGLLVKPRDAQALAASVEELVRDGALRREFGSNARQLAVAEFDVGAVVRQTLEVYRQCTLRSSAGSCKS